MVAVVLYEWRWIYYVQGDQLYMVVHVSAMQQYTVSRTLERHFLRDIGITRPWLSGRVVYG